MPARRHAPADTRLDSPMPLYRFTYLETHARGEFTMNTFINALIVIGVCSFGVSLLTLMVLWVRWWMQGRKRR